MMCLLTRDWFSNCNGNPGGESQWTIPAIDGLSWKPFGNELCWNLYLRRKMNLLYMKTRCNSKSYQFIFTLKSLEVGTDDDHNSGLRSQPTNPARCDSYEIHINGQSHKNPVSASALLTGKFLQIRKVFATSSLLAREFPDTLRYKISR